MICVGVSPRTEQRSGSMSPEERAEAIHEAYEEASGDVVVLPLTFRYLIAQAIQIHENAAYERAAVSLGYHGNPAFWDAADYLRSIANLKSQEPA